VDPGVECWIGFPVCPQLFPGNTAKLRGVCSSHTIHQMAVAPTFATQKLESVMNDSDRLIIIVILTSSLQKSGNFFTMTQ
jgi:hypothetical protein